MKHSLIWHNSHLFLVPFHTYHIITIPFVDQETQFLKSYQWRIILYNGKAMPNVPRHSTVMQDLHHEGYSLCQVKQQDDVYIQTNQDSYLTWNAVETWLIQIWFLSLYLNSILNYGIASFTLPAQCLMAPLVMQGFYHVSYSLCWVKQQDDVYIETNQYSQLT